MMASMKPMMEMSIAGGKLCWMSDSDMGGTSGFGNRDGMSAVRAQPQRRRRTTRTVSSDRDRNVVITDTGSNPQHRDE
jgi:hypothetical protein